jgi:hypothetical protein
MRRWNAAVETLLAGGAFGAVLGPALALHGAWREASPTQQLVAAAAVVVPSVLAGILVASLLGFGIGAALDLRAAWRRYRGEELVRLSDRPFGDPRRRS